MLVEIAMAREYTTFYWLMSPAIRGLPKNPLLERILPSLLQIKAATVLDEVLEAVLEQRSASPKDYGFRNDLNGRICTAAAIGIITSEAQLHAVRNRRNNVAHEFEQSVGWEDLEVDVVEIQRCLESLGVVGPRPLLTVTGERVPKQLLRDPKAVLGFDYRVIVKDAGAVVAELVFEEEILGFSGSQQGE